MSESIVGGPEALFFCLNREESFSVHLQADLGLHLFDRVTLRYQIQLASDAGSSKFGKSYAHVSFEIFFEVEVVWHFIWFFRRSKHTHWRDWHTIRGRNNLNLFSIQNRLLFAILFLLWFSLSCFLFLISFWNQLFYILFQLNLFN